MLWFFVELDMAVAPSRVLARLLNDECMQRRLSAPCAFALPQVAGSVPTSVETNETPAAAENPTV
jgi:hypothetical protein